jgi:hypothetical protein
VIKIGKKISINKYNRMLQEVSNLIMSELVTGLRCSYEQLIYQVPVASNRLLTDYQIRTKTSKHLLNKFLLLIAYHNFEIF